MGEITTTTWTPTEIRAFPGNHLYLSIPVTLASGSSYTKGTVLGKITSSGKYKAYASTNDDGSGTAEGVLAAPVDATSNDVQASMYIKGTFITSKLTGYDTTANTALGAREVEGVVLF